MVADHDVRTPIDRFVTDGDGIIRRRHAAVRHRLALVFLAQWNCTTTMSASWRARAMPSLRAPWSIARPTPLKTDEPELDAAHVDHSHRAEPAVQDSVLIEQLTVELTPAEP